MMINRLEIAGRARLSAVSLFELMVVMAVTAVLVVFFIYSAQYLTVTTRVSRVKEEHRVLKRALENYEADYGEFPDTNVGLHALDGPIAYLVRIPTDPFSEGEAKEYIYVRTVESNHRWLIVSCGPDGDSDLFRVLKHNHSLVGAVVAKVEDQPNTRSVLVNSMGDIFTRVAYDPTNGLISDGDIITTSR